MERQQLNQTLGELHQELSAAVAVDPETRQLLQQIAADINGLLRQPPEGSAAETEAAARQQAHQSALDSLLNLTSQFEESHPQLAATLGRIAEALSRMGI